MASVNACATSQALMTAFRASLSQTCFSARLTSLHNRIMPSRSACKENCASYVHERKVDKPLMLLTTSTARLKVFKPTKIGVSRRIQQGFTHRVCLCFRYVFQEK
ncbi:TPA: hypothetical protein ACH3X1_003511 [Trebouxia sp. C0004]